MEIYILHNYSGVTKFECSGFGGEVVSTSFKCLLGTVKPELVLGSEINGLRFEAIHDIIDKVKSGRGERDWDLLVKLKANDYSAHSKEVVSISSLKSLTALTLKGRLLELLLEGQDSEEIMLRITIEFQNCKLEVTDIKSRARSVYEFKQEFSGNLMKVEPDSPIHFTISAILSARPRKSFANYVFDMNKGFLENGVHSDYTLISGTGDRIRCHKMFLETCSEFFTALFQSGMKEAREEECKLEPFSKEGIEGLLRFVYYRDIQDASASSNLTFELLNMALTYQIKNLEDEMKNILLWKGNDWWETETSLDVFLRFRELDGYKLLKEKAMDVLKSYEDLKIKEMKHFG
ncbi:unnamed protein product [Orchesella dallaii]|uniref:BTB domain-containing protein n=1 Tax=Orchesella dallaii TaxID=48710 RepID=A0ABP1RYU5_9HEXA